MKRIAAFAGALAMALSAAATTAQAEPLPLARGVGVHEWLNWSPVNADKTYAWPPYRSEEAWLSGSRPLSDWPEGSPFDRIKGMGFDFVRLSVDPGPLVASEGARRAEALQILSDAVARITGAGLRVVFDLHGVSQLPETSMELIYGGADSEGVRRYRLMVRDVAAMLAAVGTDKVAIEPFNEPAYYPCDASGTDDWQRIMADTVRDIRAVSESLTIVATGACGGSVVGLVDLDPGFDDPNIRYSFHMYEPHSFTHQRAEREGGFASGLPWPPSSGTPEVALATIEAQLEAAGLSEGERRTNLAEARERIADYFAEDWNEARLEARFGEALDWARTHSIPPERLFMGEFGAIRMTADGRMGAFDPDRLRYIETVRRLAERSRIPWSIWEFSNPHGMSVIEPTGPARPDRGMLRALGLQAG